MKDMKKAKSNRATNGKGRSSDQGTEARASHRKSSSDEMTDESSEDESSNENTELMEFFVDELKDIYWAEKHLVTALPKMVKASTSDELRSAFEDHLAVTE